jgi:para-aminobenzoate synthetase component 1
MVTMDGAVSSQTPFAALQAALAGWHLPGAGAALPVPFIGGAIGFFGYGLARCLESLNPPVASDAAMPDMAFGFYDVILAFDHQRQQAWIISSGLPATGAARSARAISRAAMMRARLVQARQTAPIKLNLIWRPEISRADYLAQVTRILAWIRAGDIFQANFTSRFIATRPHGVTPAELYQALRLRNPAPFGAYLRHGDFALASASPERFIALDQAGAIETRPIKGTAPRHPDPAQDAAAAAALRASEKNLAENLMIVDLMRNDIGRAAGIGTVRVPVLAGLETFAHLHHLVSVITGQLRAGLTAVDLLRAAFPPGSVTGAPKCRAMEIIGETEIAPRGAYCGAIAWIGLDGAMDSSVIIRTLSITQNHIIAQAGGGIVADSNPADEYDEMLLKITPLLAALGMREADAR